MSIAPFTPADVEISETAWAPAGAMTFEQWADAGRQLQRMGRAVNWWLGDWILYGEQHYGEMYDQAIDLTGLEYETLKNVVWVARHVDRSRRRDSLSWSHHYEVAALDAVGQEQWLDAAERDGMTRNRLRARIQAAPAAEPEAAQDAAATHCARVTFKLVADSDDQAAGQIEQFIALLERRGAVVTQSTVRALG